MKKNIHIPQEEVDNGNVQVVRVLCTSHMTAMDDELMQNQGAKWPGLIIRDMDPGWMINLFEPGPTLEAAIAEARKHRFSDSLLNLIRTIAGEGYTHLRLDPDANEDQGFPTHTW